MAVTTDLSSNVAYSPIVLRTVATVRNLVGAPHVIFDDDAFVNFLGLARSVELKAAALALHAIASSEAHIQKVIETLELKTNGAELSKSYRAHADALLKMLPAEAATVDAVEERPKRAVSRGTRRVDGFSQGRSRGRRSEHCG